MKEDVKFFVGAVFGMSYAAFWVFITEPKAVVRLAVDVWNYSTGRKPA